MPGHVDAWGRETDGCECVQHMGSHGTWLLCGKPQHGGAIGIYGDGAVRRMCKAHVSGALRKKVFYSNEIVAIRDGGGPLYELVRTRGRRGYLAKVEVAA